MFSKQQSSFRELVVVYQKVTWHRTSIPTNDSDSLDNTRATLSLVTQYKLGDVNPVITLEWAFLVIEGVKAGILQSEYALSLICLIMVHMLETSLPVRQFQEVVEPLRHEAKRKLGPWSQGAWRVSRSKFLQELVAIKKKKMDLPIMASYPACVLSFSHTFPSYTQAFAVLIKVRHKPTQCSCL